MLPGHQVGQQRRLEIGARAGRAEGCLPLLRTVLPGHIREAADGLELLQFLRPTALDARVADLRWRVPIDRPGSHGDCDGHRRLYGEHVFALRWPAPFAAEIEYPDLVAKPAHVFAHAEERIAVQIARGGNEADDAAALLVLFQRFPQRPAPEIDVEVVQVFQLAAASGGHHGRREVAEDRAIADAILAPAHPGAGAMAIVAGRGLMPVVGRIAEADDHFPLALDRKGQPVLLRDRLHEERQLAWRRVRALQRVGQVDVGAVAGCAARKQLAAQAQLAHRVGAHEALETIQVRRQRRGVVRHGAHAIDLFNARQGMLDDAEQVGAGADRGVQRRDAWVRETVAVPHAADQRFVDEAHLRPHHFDGGVVDAGILAQHRIVGCQEIFVEVEPRVARTPARAERRSRHHCENALQQRQGCGHLHAHRRIRQHLQGAGEQTVLRGKALLRGFQR